MAGNHPNYCHSGRPLVTFCCLKVVINGQTIFAPASEWLGSWRYMGIFCEYESEGIPNHKVAGNLDLPPKFMKTNCCRKKNTKSSPKIERPSDDNLLPKSTEFCYSGSMLIALRLHVPWWCKARILKMIFSGLVIFTSWHAENWMFKVILSWSGSKVWNSGLEKEP